MKYWPYPKRMALEMSQRKFGERVGISAWRLSEIERGSPMNVEELAKILNGLENVAFYKYEPGLRVRIE